MFYIWEIEWLFEWLSRCFQQHFVASVGTQYKLQPLYYMRIILADLPFILLYTIVHPSTHCYCLFNSWCYFQVATATFQVFYGQSINDTPPPFRAHLSPSSLSREYHQPVSGSHLINGVLSITLGLPWPRYQLYTQRKRESSSCLMDLY